MGREEQQMICSREKTLVLKLTLLVQYLRELKVNLWDHIGIIVPQTG